MVHQLEAVFEHGILRPLEPLTLAEHQHVLVTISDAPDLLHTGSRLAEQRWLAAHGAGYRGQWLALQNSELLSHGTKPRDVRDAARSKGVQHPLLVHVPEDFGEPSAGWL
jgi:predicted DNA-binding antitoxin AbrB/MazE fold protein